MIIKTAYQHVVKYRANYFLLLCLIIISGNLFHLSIHNNLGILNTTLFALFLCFAIFQERVRQLRCIFGLIAFIFFMIATKGLHFDELLSVVYFCLLLYSFLLPSIFPPIVVGGSIIYEISTYFGTLPDNVILVSIIGILLNTFVYIYLAIFIRKLTTERDSLKISREQITNILNSVDLAIWSADVKTKQITHASGIEKVYGYTKENFNQYKNLWLEAIHPDDLKFVDQRRANLSTGHKTTYEYRIIDREGTIKWIEDHAIPVVDESGELERISE